MQAARILPDLQCSLVCEEVRQEANGNFFQIGVINYIRVPKLPVTALRLTIYNRWTAGIGQFTGNAADSPGAQILEAYRYTLGAGHLQDITVGDGQHAFEEWIGSLDAALVLLGRGHVQGS